RSLVGHAYLFSGPRGCGKTTVARLLAKALNCVSLIDGYEPCCECKNCLAIAGGESLDVIEIDGASNNGVDEVRELKSHVTLAPFSSRYKIYIIDEVHMLSISAFNALLKTLEEPPACVVFILATTEAHKVPVTIRSRCQHIPFHRIGVQEIYDRLLHIASLEGLSCAPEALWEIARQADGALRDALSMLEQVAGLGKEEVTLADVEMTLGQGSRSSLERWVAGWRKGEMETFVELDRILAMGASPQRFVEELFSLVRNLWLGVKWKDVPDVLGISEQEKEYLKTEAPFWDSRKLESIMGFLSELLPQVRMGMRTDVLSGLLMAKMTHVKEEEKEESTAGSTPPGALSASAFSRPSRPSKEGTKAKDLKAMDPKAIEPKREESPASLPQEKGIPAKEARPAASQAKAKKREKPAEEGTLEPLDSTGWKPCAESEWNGVLDALREKDLLLYCGLIDAQPFKEEKEDKKRLILDITDRYCYEVLKLERHRTALKIFLALHCPEFKVILRHKALWTSCESQEGPFNPSKTSEKTSAGPADSDFFDLFSMESARGAEEAPAKGVPFVGLVREVTRWLRGDVILVRRGEDENEDEGDAIAEISADISIEE
ncbi:MAG: DNA polymerase III subunit gamma/tau, partial [Synergistaceae bacterium]|nr:DNA polymerase III subunit gamma/tau [Synergistaceae bacterium]